MAFESAIDSLAQSGKHLARADFENHGNLLRDDEAYRLRPLDRAMNLLHQQFAEPLRLGFGTRMNIVHHRHCGRTYTDTGKIARKLLTGRLHQAGMKRGADRERQGSLGAFFLACSDSALHGGRMTCDHYLARGIEIHRCHDLGASRLNAGQFDQIIIQSEHSRHGALPDRYRRLHIRSAIANQSHRIGELQSTRTNQRGEFAKAMPGHILGTHATAR